MAFLVGVLEVGKANPYLECVSVCGRTNLWSFGDGRAMESMTDSGPSHFVNSFG